MVSIHPAYNLLTFFFFFGRGCSCSYQCEEWSWIFRLQSLQLPQWREIGRQIWACRQVEVGNCCQQGHQMARCLSRRIERRVWRETKGARRDCQVCFAFFVWSLVLLTFLFFLALSCKNLWWCTWWLPRRCTYGPTIYLWASVLPFRACMMMISS